MTLSEAYNQIAIEKATYANLSGFAPSNDTLDNYLADVGSSPSQVAVWRNWTYLMAYSQTRFSDFMDLFKTNIEAEIAALQPGTMQWLVGKVLAFQYGDPLVYVNNQYSYQTIDASKHIVTQCAGVEVGGRVFLKVAKTAGGVLVPLSTPELLALNSYIGMIKYAGTLVVAVSYTADLLSVAYTIYYDPKVGLSIVQPAVEIAIGAFIKGLPFNGKLMVTHLTDTIQQVTGVVNPVAGLIQARYGTLPFAAIGDEYQSNAGYCAIDSATPLSATITYLPYV